MDEGLEQLDDEGGMEQHQMPPAERPRADRTAREEFDQKSCPSRLEPSFDSILVAQSGGISYALEWPAECRQCPVLESLHEARMTVSAKSLGIDKLNVDDRLALVEEIWQALLPMQRSFLSHLRKGKSSTAASPTMTGSPMKSYRGVK
ncbi:MAG TPA: hypothetical protein VLW55_16825 [Burkholderiaceae bacterium]|nr:hypothetical protein [Burkholderiaceae bacterium]